MAENPAGLGLQLCPGCSCGIPSHSKICDYCLAVLSFGSEGRWVVDGRICGACGAESTIVLAPCPRCRTPRSQSCPSCELETMRLDAPRCPNCQTAREEFFDVCVEEAARRRRKVERETRMKPRLTFLAFAFYASLVLAFGYYKGHFDTLREILFMCFLASIFLAIGLLPTLKK